MRIFVLKLRFVIVLFLLIVGCKKEGHDYAPISELRLQVFDDQGKAINGAHVSIFENKNDYDQNNNSNIQSLTSKSNNEDGTANISLNPGKTYYLLVTYFDPIRNLTLSNKGISSVIEPLPARTISTVKMKIRPDNGMLVFYTLLGNKLPISITISNSKTNISRNITLNKFYSGKGNPSLYSDSILIDTLEQGSYNYYAKSPDGCLWQGTINLEKGNTQFIEFSQCTNELISFYTSSVPDSLLPLKVILNNTDTVGIINGRRQSLSCTDEKSNSLTFYKDPGYYTYTVSTSNKKCIWTGHFNSGTGSCIIIPIEGCK